MDTDAPFEAMLGKTATRVESSSPDSLEFDFTDGTRLCFYHQQSCCEHVYIEDITGDLADLAGAPIGMAEAVSERGHEDSGDWTFYKFATAKGFVTVRWWGRDNYYSTSVDHEWSAQ